MSSTNTCNPVHWTNAPIPDCRIMPLERYTDSRGWLCEFFRHDTLPPGLHPAMGYVSLTHAGVTRGPHEHRDQTDLFVFFSGAFRLYLWDSRKNSPTRGHRQVADLGERCPAAVSVPPGVIHAYRNVGSSDAILVNCPNRLYGGEGKASPVDEIRHEESSHLVLSME